MGRFELQQDEDGQIYVSENGTPLLDAELHGEGRVTVQIGIDGCVEVDKLYGPLIFASVRVRPDFESCEWVIEREHGTVPGDWREVARVPGQLESDFAERAPA
jgi:hypothetical protein